MTQIPTANPFAPTPVYPTAPPRPTGIMGGIPILPGEFYYITNMWQGRIGASYVQVICVTEQQDRSQGMLYVRTLSDASVGSSKAPQQGPIWYKLPAKVGPVEVTAENGLVLTLSAVKDPATKFIFDVGQRTWVFPLGQPPIPAVPATPPLPHP